VALCAGEEVPDWVLARLHELPDTLRESAQRANRYEGAVLNLVEAALLQHRVGETFPGVVVEVDRDDQSRGTVTVQDPAVEARVTGTGDLPLGEDVTVTLATADPEARKVEFTLG
jgi:exoribonuclease R